jgi:septal ring factor EnvC (AmiA/AmiB activator)
MDRPMTSKDEPKRVEELLRVNAELAGELRELSEGRIEAPRPGRNPAARRLARLHAERDSLAKRLEETEAALAALQADRDGLERQNQEFAAEIAQLRSGFAGLLRRARARIVNR